MKLLCADTATRTESLALLDGDELVAERAVRRKRGHGPGLLDDLDGLLADAGWALRDIEGFVCGLGPGSFTGLRIALAALKGLAMALDTPIYGARTTRMITASRPGPQTFAVLDARRRQVYLDGEGMARPVVCDPGAIGAHLPTGLDKASPITLLGDGAPLYRQALVDALPDFVVDIPAGPLPHTPRAALLAGLVDLSQPAPLATLEPTYVRRSDAEINYPDGFPDAATRARAGRKASRRG